MGIVSKLFGKSKEKPSDDLNKSEDIKDFPQEFDYNPLEDQVKFNIVEDTEIKDCYYLIMELYDKGINVSTSGAQSKNEVILRRLEHLQNSPDSAVQDSTVLAKNCKDTYIAINEIIADDKMQDVEKLATISRHLLELPHINNSESCRFKCTSTEDGLSFDKKAANANKIDDLNHSKEYYDMRTSGELLRYDIKGPISFKKSLKRNFNDEKQFGKIERYESKSYMESLKSVVETDPPTIDVNNQDKNIKTPNEISEP